MIIYDTNRCESCDADNVTTCYVPFLRKSICERCIGRVDNARIELERVLKPIGGCMKKTMTAVCAMLIAGRCLAQDLGPVPLDTRLTTTSEQAESVIAESEAEWKDKHPKMYAAGWTLVISVIGYALLAAIDKAGGDTNYNVSGDLNNANGNGGNGSSDSSNTDQNTGMGNNER